MAAASGQGVESSAMSEAAERIFARSQATTASQARATAKAQQKAEVQAYKSLMRYSPFYLKRHP